MITIRYSRSLLALHRSTSRIRVFSSLTQILKSTYFRPDSKVSPLDCLIPMSHVSLNPSLINQGRHHNHFEKTIQTLILHRLSASLKEF